MKDDNKPHNDFEFPGHDDFEIAPGQEDSEADVVTKPRSSLLSGSKTVTGDAQSADELAERSLEQQRSYDAASWDGEFGPSDESAFSSGRIANDLDDDLNVTSAESNFESPQSINVTDAGDIDDHKLNAEDEMVTMLRVQASSSLDVHRPELSPEESEEEAAHNDLNSTGAANDDNAEHEQTDALRQYRDSALKWGSFRVAFLAELIVNHLNEPKPLEDERSDVEITEKILELKRNGELIEASALLGELYSERGMGVLLESATNYRVTHRSGGQDFAFDVELSENKQSCAHFVDGQDQFDVDISTPKGALNDPKSVQYSAVASHVKEVVESMYRSGLDTFVVAGNDKMVQMFQAAVNEISKRDNVKLSVMVDNNQQQLDLDSDKAARSKQASENASWMEKSGGYGDLSESEKDLADQAHQKWVAENPETHTFGLKDYVGFVQENHAVSAMKNDEGSSSRSR